MGKWRARPCVGGCDQCIYGEMESQSGGRKAILPAALPIADLAWGLAATKVGQAAFPPPPAPARPGTPGLALRWRHGSATALVPWAPTPMGTTSHQQATAQQAPSHQQASHPLTSPSSESAQNPSLRLAGAVPLGPTGKAAQEMGRGEFGASRAGHVPRHLNQSRSRPSLRNASFWLPSNSGTLPEIEMRHGPAIGLTVE